MQPLLIPKTTMAKPAEIRRNWFVVDGTGQVVGRLAAQIARILMGKHKPDYTPYADSGDYVIVVNAEKVVFTGRKLTQKVYHRHTGYPGGLRSTTAKQLLQEHPERVLTLAVKGMLPKNKLGRAQLKKLKVYAGAAHPHEAQRPQPLEV